MIRPLALVLIVASVFLAGCNNGSKPNSDQGTDRPQNISTDSIVLLTELISKDSSDHNLFKLRATKYLAKGQVDPAFRDVSYALDLNSGDPDLFKLLGDIYFYLGDVDNSVASYRRAMQLDPKNEERLVDLGITYLMLNDLEKATLFIDRAAAMNYKNPNVYYWKGVIETTKADTASAIMNFKIAYNLDSTNHEALSRLTALLIFQNDSTAINYIDAMLQMSPDSERAMFQKALFYQERGEYEKALSIYENINKLYPDNQTALFNSGYIILVEYEDLESAREFFTEVLSINPSHVGAVYNLGLTYESMGMFDEARLQYRKTLELKTNYQLAIDGLNRLE